MLEILYIFGGEKAQGAEIVIERLINHNTLNVNAHLMISPGSFADKLTAENKSYKIIRLDNLKKLNRSSTNPFNFFIKAIINYVTVSYVVYRYLKKNKINIIHANTIVPASYLLPLIAISKILMPKKVWIWSDHDMKYFSAFEHYLCIWCSALYNCTLVVSEAVKRKYTGSKKVLVLYNGLDTNLFKPYPDKRKAFRIKLGIKEDDIVLGIAANICPGKGQLSLIEAFQGASAYGPSLKLLIAGNYALDDTAYNSKVRDAIVLNKNIIFLGFVDDVIDFYNGCDIVINNSDLVRSESLGTSIYEAMACEKILIASSTGGTPEIITNGTDGFLFEPERVDNLEKVIVDVMLKYNSLENIKTAARETVKRKFNILGMVRDYNNVVQLVLP